MTRQIVLRSPASAVGRRQPLLENSDYSSRGGLRKVRLAEVAGGMLENSDYSSRGGLRKVRLAEVAGGTTAECAAVCCCCPCGLVNLFVLAVYKVPAGLCRKALRRKRHRRLMKKGLLPSRKCGCDEEFFQIHPVTSPLSTVTALESLSDNREVIELEKEMWDKFYGAGFWRSPSQRSEISALQ